jgi:hypothetical protein
MLLGLAHLHGDGGQDEQRTDELLDDFASNMFRIEKFDE